MIPFSYELKRLIAQHQHRFWYGDMLAGLPAAPVYLFPDQEHFDSDEVEVMVRQYCSGQVCLPHRDVLFEVTHRHERFTAVTAFATKTVDDEFIGFLFTREGTRWTDVQCNAVFRADGYAGYEVHPSITSESHGEQCGSILTGLVWRALALLSRGSNVTDNRVPQVRRPKLARSGVSGWIYRVVDIDPDRVKAAAAIAGGTHASPRWHIRRGHWRTLPNGRRTFVRECEVGDPDRGGVVKDYRVRMESAA